LVNITLTDVVDLDLQRRVDKDADGRITEEEIKEVNYKIITFHVWSENCSNLNFPSHLIF